MPLGVASPPSADAERPHVHDRLILETQRRSAAYHLRELLDLRRDIWADLLTGITSAEHSSFNGDVDALVGRVWRWTVTRDQLQSDLTMLDAQMEVVVDNAGTNVLWGILNSSAVAYFLSFKNDSAGGRSILWAMLTASGIHLLYSGLGLGLSLRARALVSRIARMAATDELRSENRDDLSGPSWHFLQFSNALW